MVWSQAASRVRRAILQSRTTTVAVTAVVGSGGSGSQQQLLQRFLGSPTMIPQLYRFIQPRSGNRHLQFSTQRSWRYGDPTPPNSLRKLDPKDRSARAQAYVPKLYELLQEKDVEVPTVESCQQAWMFALYLHRLDRNLSVQRIFTIRTISESEIEEELVRMQKFKLKNGRLQTRWRWKGRASLVDRWKRVLDQAVVQALIEREAPVSNDIRVNRLRLVESVLNVVDWSEPIDANAYNFKPMKQDPIERALVDDANALADAIQKNKERIRNRRRPNEQRKLLEAMLKERGVNAPVNYSPYTLALVVHRIDREQGYSELFGRKVPTTQEVFRYMDSIGKKKTKNGIERTTVLLKRSLRAAREDGSTQALQERNESVLGDAKERQQRLVESVLGIPEEERQPIKQKTVRAAAVSRKQ